MQADVCPICQSALPDQSFELGCHHKFHPECLIPWFRLGNHTCPVCRDAGEGKGRGRGRGRGRGQMPQPGGGGGAPGPAAAPPPVLQHIREPINVAFAKEIASLHAAATLKVYAPRKRADDRPPHEKSLRSILFEYITRAEIAGGDFIDVLWSEEPLGRTTNKALRRFSGASSDQAWRGMNCAENLDKLKNLGFSPWRASCSAFSESKLVREILRCDLPVVDVDQSVAAWRAVAHRHPTSAPLQAFFADAHYETLYVNAGNGDRKVGKALYTGLITGCGANFLSQWREDHQLPIPVEVMALKDEMARLRELDCAAHPELLALLQHRARPEMTLQSVLNEEFERGQLQLIIDAVQQAALHTKVVSFEHDGALFHNPDVLPEHLGNWRLAVLQAAVSVVPSVAVKPYKSKQEISEFLSTYGRGANPSWRLMGEYSLELTRRLGSESSMPDILVSALVSEEFIGSVRVQDIYKLVPSVEQDNAKVGIRGSNGRWEFVPVKIAASRLKDAVLVVIQRHMPWWHEGDLPGWTRRGKTMLSAAMQTITDFCYDGEFFKNLDNEACRRYVMFKDGQVLDRNTLQLCRLPEVF